MQRIGHPYLFLTMTQAILFLFFWLLRKMTQANWEHKVLINAMDMSKSHNNFIIFLA